jgi:hypothetical protein
MGWRGALPLVRWPRGSAGPESNLPCRSAWVTTRCRPTTASRGGSSTSRDVAPRGQSIHCWRSLQFSRCYLGATNQGICVNQGGALAEAQGIEPRQRRIWRPPGDRCLAPLECSFSLGPSGTKRAASFRKRLSDGYGPVKVLFMPSRVPPRD